MPSTIGGTGNDTLVGNTSPNTLRGLLGNDRLFDLDGDDTLIWSEGTDLADGATGVNHRQVESSVRCACDRADRLGVPAGTEPSMPRSDPRPAGSLHSSRYLAGRVEAPAQPLGRHPDARTTCRTVGLDLIAGTLPPTLR